MKIKKLFNNPKAKIIWNKFIDWIIGAAIGAVFGAIFSGNWIPATIFSVVLLGLLFIHIVLSIKTNDNCDILKILNGELNANNYIAVIRIGRALSRPLHLSGRYTLRNEIGHITKKACDQLDDNKKLLIDDRDILVAQIKAQTLIDDLGWTSYELGRNDTAIDNINTGIQIAKDIKDYKLAVKGYRHLIGILNSLHREEDRDKKIQEAINIINSQEYKDLFNDESDYEHAKAEFDYAYARTLIDSDPQKALMLAERVQTIFETDQKNDRDRYVKTFDLIGDIYARSNTPASLKKAKRYYYDGIIKCEECGRTERLLRISNDYIRLLIKMIENSDIYNSKSWQDVDKDELFVYEKALGYAQRTENYSYRSKFKKLHKQYIKARNRIDKG